MLCAFQTFSGDIHRLKELLEWINKLGECRQHEAVIVCDYDTDWNRAKEAVVLATKTFASASLISNDKSVLGWIDGPKSLFLASARHAEQRNLPFLVMETDAVPTQSGWLDKIDSAYQQSGKPYMGCLYACQQPNLPSLLMSGIGVYPASAFKELAGTILSGRNWDVAMTSVVVPQAAHSDLIQHFWGEPNLPPTFVAHKTRYSPRNAFTLDNIKPETVLFHRCKDRSLISLLNQRLFPNQPRLDELAVALPFCHMDHGLMLKGLKWLKDFHGQLPRTAVLHFDSTARSFIREIQETAQGAFAEVLLSSYQNSPYTGWPAACNWAFRHACWFARDKLRRPWFWMEADTVGVKANWLYELESEYASARTPFMGTIITDMGHMNGVAVYPSRVEDYTSSVLTAVERAWDTAMHAELGSEMVGLLCHKANHLIQHCGAVVDGKCKPSNGAHPKFASIKDVKDLVEPTALVFHPVKDGSLIDRLREQN